ncbi:MAG: peptidoglycan-binding protein, partial [Clostridiales bacterium]|nr:peptidoglycan-binding protein [Clostridiales bacterium]
MEIGYLKVNATAGGESLPVAGAKITVTDKDGNVLYEDTANANGESTIFELDAPDAALTLKPDTAAAAFAAYGVLVTHSGFADKLYRGVEIVAGQTAILNVALNPLARGAANAPEEITIPPPSTAQPTGRQDQAGADRPTGRQDRERTDETAGRQDRDRTDGATGRQAPERADGSPQSGRGARVLPDVIVPETITVHLGRPAADAQNVRVRFSDYIKNVVSSEIFPTWPENSIIANIHAAATFALNRVYTEWYRAKGYPFDITNSTAFDQCYIHGRDIFQNIGWLTDEYFDIYAKRQGYKNPFFTQYCNGTTAACRGLSQWGTVSLAQNGYSPLGILRYYYGNDITLDRAPVGGVAESYPGTALRQGASGADILRTQRYLNRIRQNYPGIPAIANPDGYFGRDTANAVKTFQRIFGLAQDGVVGKATWYKISQIYTGVTGLAELGGEGEKEGAGGGSAGGGSAGGGILRYGSSGPAVAELQHLLNFAGYYYDAIPPIAADSLFGPATQNAVLAFQRQFGLAQDGIV